PLWSMQQELVASDAALEDGFGTSVSVWGDTLLAGAPRFDQAASPIGSAYAFVRSGTVWTEQQKIAASDGVPDNHFGSSVSLFGDTAVVGADNGNPATGPGAGSAYVFVRRGTTWTERQKLLASDEAASDLLGSSVSISGPTVLAGAPAHDSAGLD